VKLIVSTLLLVLRKFLNQVALSLTLEAFKFHPHPDRPVEEYKKKKRAA
jgi:hypothetical protein